MPNLDSELRRPAEIGHLSDAPWLNASYSRMAEKPWQSAAPRTTSVGWRATIATPAIRLWSRLRRARRTRLTITRLEALDEHILKDIGIHRCQIESVARWAKTMRLECQGHGNTALLLMQERQSAISTIKLKRESHR
jgi:uncharacterized protein YjiS (DUF1127 family)